MTEPQTLADAVHHYSTAPAHIPAACPRCGGTDLGRIASRPHHQCRECQYQFSARHGTRAANSRVAAWKWLVAEWCVQHGDTTSIRGLARAIGVTHVTAIRMLRICRV